MPAPISAYLMAFFGMALSATSGLALFSFVDHLDPPDVEVPPAKRTAPEHLAA